MRIVPACALAFWWLIAPAAVGRAVVRFEPASVVVAPGRHATAELAFVVADGYHIQANPASADTLIPAVVEVRGGCGVSSGAAKYPPAVPYRLQGADLDLATYSGRFTVRVPLVASSGATAIAGCVLHGTLHYQACDARTCLAPATLAFDLSLRGDGRFTGSRKSP